MKKVSLATLLSLVLLIVGIGFTAPSCNSGSNNQTTNTSTQDKQRLVLQGVATAEISLTAAFDITEDLVKSGQISRELEKTLLTNYKMVNKYIKMLNSAAGKIDVNKLKLSEKMAMLDYIRLARKSLQTARDTGITDIVSQKFGSSVGASLASVESVLVMAESAINLLKVVSNG